MDTNRFEESQIGDLQVQSEKQPLDLERLLLIAGGHSAFQLLWAGTELGLYDFLSRHGDSTLDDAAEGLGLARQPARILLVGLTALGVVEKEGGRFRNAVLTENMLVSDSSGSAAPILGWQSQIVYKGLQDFVRSLKENRNVGLRHFPGQGDTLYERLVADPALEHVFQDAMSALSANANAALGGVDAINGLNHLVDVGGGDATNAIALARRFPHLKITVFDSPTVCQRAQAKIAEAGLDGRIDTWPGELFSDPFPAGIDAILYAHIMTIWSPERNLEILQKSHAALPEGGCVLIFNMMASDDDTGPLSTALGSPYFLAIATGEGMLYSWRDYEQLLGQAGFGTINRRAGFALDHGLLIATK